MFTPLRFIFIVYIACVFNVSVNFVAGLYEGDSCSFDDGSVGTCKYLTDCPASISLLQQGIFPKAICGFEGTKSIVCCKDTTNGAGVTQRTTTTTTTTTQAPTTTHATTSKPPVVTNRLPGDISKQKCKEYAQYAYDRHVAPTLTIKPHYSTILECAYEKLKLIVGGTLASRKEFPHMALIGYRTKDEVVWACGGSLISENVVLTAGHCLRNRELGTAKLVRLGITNQTDPSQLQELSVSEVIDYPEYTAKYHDIGLLRLSEPAKMNTFVRPACLQTEKHIPYNTSIASGWGKIEFSGDSSNDLLKVVLEFFSTQTCNTKYRREMNAPNSKLKDGIVEDIMICAGSTTDLKDTCQGDSGGPLQVYHDDSEGIKCMYNIVGVTAFGKSCGLAKNVPGVYTRVSAYLKWIEDNVWP